MSFDYKICCFIGHRIINAAEVDTVKERIRITAEKLIKNETIFFCTNCALGFGLLAGEEILDIKRNLYHHIQVVAVLPYLNPEQDYINSDRRKYYNIVNNADRIVFTGKRTYPGCYGENYRYMLNNSQDCICYMLHDKGETSKALNYSKNLKINIFNVAKENYLPENLRGNDTIK